MRIRSIGAAFCGVWLSVLTACGAAPENDAATATTAEGEDVATTGQALGDWRVLWQKPDAGKPIHLGPVYSLFKKPTQPSGCNHAYFVDTVTGADLTLPELDGTCSPIGAAGSDGQDLVVEDVGARRLRTLGRTTLGQYVWHPGAATGGRVTKIVLGATHFFWSDDDGVHRMTKEGQSKTTLVTGRRLLGVDADYLYLARQKDSTWILSRKPLAGGAENKIREDVPDIRFLSVDRDHIFYADEVTAKDQSRTYRLLRIRKDGSDFRVIRQARRRIIAPSGPMPRIYWREIESDAGGVATMFRIGGPSSATEVVPGVEPPIDGNWEYLSHTLVTDSGVYLAKPYGAASALIRGSL